MQQSSQPKRRRSKFRVSDPVPDTRGEDAKSRRAGAIHGDVLTSGEVAFHLGRGLCGAAKTKVILAKS